MEKLPETFAPSDAWAISPDADIGCASFGLDAKAAELIGQTPNLTNDDRLGVISKIIED
jgi:hypothetical protein